jgi:hypothetical protein
LRRPCRRMRGRGSRDPARSLSHVPI